MATMRDAYEHTILLWALFIDKFWLMPGVFSRMYWNWIGLLGEIVWVELVFEAVNYSSWALTTRRVVPSFSINGCRQVCEKGCYLCSPVICKELNQSPWLKQINLHLLKEDRKTPSNSLQGKQSTLHFRQIWIIWFFGELTSVAVWLLCSLTRST